MSDAVQPAHARRFALRCVEKLRAAGFQALWAGGCVRDELLGIEPNDYDVATNATPDEVRACFGKRHTLAIGAAFGVVAVLGRREEGQIEVATFRRDAAYSDGRHPDAVSFSTAREDALRRDFTMNGLFLDPLTGEVLDYVGGRADLEARVVRAIGNPNERFAEDKLRMLRAVRFASTFDFHIDADTMAAVQREAATIPIVSAERIATELRKILVPASRARGVELLRELRLLDAILPESRVLFSTESLPTESLPTESLPTESLPTESLPTDPPHDRSATRWWPVTLRVLDSLREPTFRVALAALLWSVHAQDPQPPRRVAEICGRWRLSNHDADGAAWLLTHESLLRRASTLPWPTLQRILIAAAIDELVMLAEAIARNIDAHVREIDYCRAKLRLPREVLNPPPLISGDDLRAAGYAAGPPFRDVLTQVRDAQLESQIADREEALRLARKLLGPEP
ncbi:MAG: CCA tRNA nucleotidyltransferase [Pirellulaceae bacterium]